MVLQRYHLHYLMSFLSSLPFYLGWLTMASLTGLSIGTLIQGDTQQLQKRSTMQTRSIFKYLYWEQEWQRGMYLGFYIAHLF